MRKRPRLLPALPVMVGVLLAGGLYSYLVGGTRPQRPHTAVDSRLNVILITLDGVRIDEFLGNKADDLAPGDAAPLMPFFWEHLAPTGEIYGDNRKNQYMTVANPALVSLPAYQSIFAGSPQPCQSNDCEYIEQLTFPERLVTDLNLKRRQVATIASWEGLLFATESHPGRTFVNAGLEPLKDRGDAEELLLNEQQQVDHPRWADCRFDKYTWRHAMRYLDRHRPRFLYISLDDADGWGHQVEYDQYLGAIRNYDHWLGELVTKLHGMDEYGRRTCLIVTTDHGRGKGDKWYTHSNGELYSGLVLMYAGCPLATNGKVFRTANHFTTHLDIRPTVEALFGLAPINCALCGESLVEKRALSARWQRNLSGAFQSFL